MRETHKMETTISPMDDAVTMADAATSVRLRHAVTVDVEDWPQSSFDYDLPITERAATNTRRMLELFAENEIRGTFFVLGLLADAFPEVVREIAAAGHEVASHGYSHRPVFQIGREAFQDELDRSVKQLEDITGQSVYGYRAPDFSITADSLWALDCLADYGMQYDSSVMPVQMRRYGISGFPREIHQLENGLWEVPLSTTLFGGRHWPVAGGGYLRLYPYAVTSHALRQHEEEGRPAVVYLHPYEVDPQELSEIDLPIPLKTRMTQGLNRSRVAGRLRRLFCEFEFTTLHNIVTSVSEMDDSAKANVSNRSLSSELTTNS